MTIALNPIIMILDYLKKLCQKSICFQIYFRFFHFFIFGWL